LRTDLPSRSANRLLAALPQVDYERIMAHLHPVSLTIKQLLYEPEAPIDHVYFPLNSIVSEIVRMKNGDAVEVATVGNEGVVGIPALLGLDRTPLFTFTQIAGNALRIRTDDMKDEMERGGSVLKIVLRYTEALFIQVAMGSACSRLHLVPQRCARWILMTHDRVGQDEFTLTQEFLCQMLGVRRATVSEAASALQEDDIIRYSRGKMSIVNRAKLEELSCECYGVIQSAYRKLLNPQEDSSQ
jgi:CRP-like cAMP-binding protein